MGSPALSMIIYVCNLTCVYTHRITSLYGRRVGWEATTYNPRFLMFLYTFIFSSSVQKYSMWNILYISFHQRDFWSRLELLVSVKRMILWFFIWVGVLDSVDLPQWHRAPNILYLVNLYNSKRSKDLCLPHYPLLQDVRKFNK